MHIIHHISYRKKRVESKKKPCWSVELSEQIDSYVYMQIYAPYCSFYLLLLLIIGRNSFFFSRFSHSYYHLALCMCWLLFFSTLVSFNFSYMLNCEHLLITVYVWEIIK